MKVEFELAWAETSVRADSPRSANRSENMVAALCTCEELTADN